MDDAPEGWVRRERKPSSTSVRLHGKLLAGPSVSQRVLSARDERGSEPQSRRVRSTSAPLPQSPPRGGGPTHEVATRSRTEFDVG
eukprot:1875049-Prymnesium_polylepis.1